MKISFRSVISFILILVMVFSLTACSDAEPTPEASESGTEISTPDSNTSDSSDANESSSESEEEETSMPANAPGSFLDQILDFHAQNNDTVGWLYVPGTDINESVVQSSDNDYYLRRTNLKAVDQYGSYFADYECNFANGNLPTNTIIYGHSMETNDDPNGSRFSQLKRYLDQDFAEANPYIYFSTPEEDLVYKIFSVMYTTTYFNYIDPEPTSTEFLAVINEARVASQFNYPVEVNATDSIIALSTCTYAFDSRYPNRYRYVVFGRLVRPGEETPATVDIEVNPSPKAPVLG